MYEKEIVRKGNLSFLTTEERTFRRGVIKAHMKGDFVKFSVTLWENIDNAEKIEALLKTIESALVSQKYSLRKPTLSINGRNKRQYHRNLELTKTKAKIMKNLPIDDETKKDFRRLKKKNDEGEIR